MPQVRKLAPEEIKEIENKGKGLRKLTAEEYDGFLTDYEIGEYGEAQLGADEKRLTVRNRLKAAAERRHIGLDFKRTQGNIIRFKVIEPGSVGGNGVGKSSPRRTPIAKAAPPPPAKRKGGRPKKAQ